MKAPNRTHLSFRPSKRNLDLIDRLDKLALLDNRKPNNYIEIILLKHVTEKERQIFVGKRFD